MKTNFKVMCVFGTRPEAIKMAPVVLELKKQNFKTVTVVTGQHREMLQQVLEIFEISPEYDLDIMKLNQSLSDITNNVINKLEPVLIKEKPDLVLVQGDTSSAFVVSLQAYYAQIPVGHVEAGLRTYDKYSPFPEEINRQLIDVISDIYFAPTYLNEQNLIREGKNKNQVFITGNTVIDAALYIADKDLPYQGKVLKKINFFDSRYILFPCHRRETFGEKQLSIFKGVQRLLSEHPDVKLIYPVHLNPQVSDVAHQVFKNNQQVILLNPLSYVDIVNLMRDCYLIITDSGGIQEEAPAFNKPVLVVREKTERNEGVKAGCIKLVGTDSSKILESGNLLLNSVESYEGMAKAASPYGNGTAAQKTAEAIKTYFKLNS